MKKRILSMLLVLAMLCGAWGAVTPVYADHAATDIAYSVKGGNIYFDKATGTITGCDRSVTNAVIPKEIAGAAVTSIGTHAFFECSNLADVTIPTSVTNIEWEAFCSCSSLRSVKIPASVTNISPAPFSICENLTGIWVDAANPNYCSDASGVLFDHEKTILIQAPGAISGKYSIPASVTSIKNFAFSFCTRLSSVTIPAGVIDIEESPFDGCENLTGIWVDAANPNYCSDAAGVLFNHDKTTLIEAPGAISGHYAIPDSVENISCCAFRGCIELSGVTIPNNVTSIGEQVFSYCLSLTSVMIPADVTSIGYMAFMGCHSLTSVTIPANVTDIGTYAFSFCNKLQTVKFMGDAPTLEYDGFVGYNTFDHCDVNLTLYFLKGRKGWTTPKWCGYPTASWNGGEFVDVAGDKWYSDAVEFALQRELMAGTGADRFSPNSPMTRAMLVTVLWRYAGSLIEGTNRFTDVPNGKWYTNAVVWAAQNGIVSGTSKTKFSPNGSVTREQTAAILFRFARKQGVDTSKRGDISAFPDVGAVSNYAKEPMQWCAAEGIIYGSDGKLNPKGNATRAQVAAILMRFIENVVEQ